MLQIRKTIALSLLLAATRTPSQQISSLRPFHPGLSMPGTIRCWGSPQMAPLLSLWEEDFRRFHPEITFANNLKSTVSAIAGVYTGVADVGVLGRTIWPTETMAYQTVTGRSPIGIEVATGSFDEPKATFALGVFVHRTNPLTRLTTSQLEAILREDIPDPIRKWSQLGLAEPLGSHSITPYIFDRENDKIIFLENAILHGSHHLNRAVREFENSMSSNRGSIDAGEAIFSALGHDPDGIAISNTHYANSDVKLIALATTSEGPYILPTRVTVQDHTYPLTRTVAIYPARTPDGRISPLAAEFLRYILSREGQAEVTAEAEYLPLSPALAQVNLDRLK
jgi:phosphate transport system substrate-binding protein